MRQKILNKYRELNLASKIRTSYLILVVPFLILLGTSIYFSWANNNRYNRMIEAAVAASEFSLDFKKDFDDETYLLIVGNKTIEESRLNELLQKAEHVIEQLRIYTVSEKNYKKLKSAEKYLNNLAVYKGRIENNLSSVDMYEENILIWENDVQIVTNLLQDTMSEYIYYEIRAIEEARDQFNLGFFRNLMLIVAFLLIFGIVFVFLSYYIPYSISRPIMEISEVTRQITEGNLSSRTNVTSGGEVGELGKSLNVMIDKINELIDQVTIEQIRLRDAELELLQAQINPHFLYNTLDAIVWLAEAGDHKKVVSMVGSLSDFFRTSLSKGKDVLSLKEELVHVRSYLEIQQIRYQDILEYDINVPEELYSCMIPKITLQPIVENALYHGIKNKRGMGKINIEGAIEDNACIITIVDNGKGMDEDRLKLIRNKIAHIDNESNEIYGLSNVNERIQLKFGSEFGIKIYSRFGEGTTVKIYLPLKN